MINQPPWMAALDAQLNALATINKLIRADRAPELHSGWQIDQL